MSKAFHAPAAGALVLAAGLTLAGVPFLGGCGTGGSGTGAEPHRTVVPAPSPSPAVSVPAETHPAQVPDYAAIPAPTAGTEFAVPAPVPEAAADAVPGSGDPDAPTGQADDAGASAVPGDGSGDCTAVAGPEQLALAARTAWDGAEQQRVAAALAAADACTAAHPDTAEAAVYASVRADLARGSAEDGTTLVTRALRSAGYTFTGFGPADISGWFAAHPGSGTVLQDASLARPGSLVLAYGPAGEAVLGVYLGGGLAVFGGDAAPLAGAVSDAAPACAGPAFIAPADLSRETRQLSAGQEIPAPVYVRPAPFA